MKTQFGIGDVIRVSFDRKVIDCRIIGQNEKYGTFLVESLTATETGKVHTWWVKASWILEG